MRYEYWFFVNQYFFVIIDFCQAKMPRFATQSLNNYEDRIKFSKGFFIAINTCDGNYFSKYRREKKVDTWNG